MAYRAPVPTTWEATAARLGEKIADAEDLDAKLTRLCRAARGQWGHYINLTVAHDTLATARPVDEEKLNAVELKMRMLDQELYALESQIKATDRAILALPRETEWPIVASSVWSAAKRRRLREGR